MKINGAKYGKLKVNVIVVCLIEISHFPRISGNFQLL